MDELQQQERNRLFRMRLKYIEDIFNTQITDENIKEYIFDSTNFRKCVAKVPDYISYIENILNLAFVFAYGCYRVDLSSERSSSINAKKTGALRIINSLKKAYSLFPVTPDLTQFVLTDIQFEMARGNDSEIYDVFSPMCRFSDKGFSLTKYYKIIKEWKAGPSRFNMDQNELAILFAQLLDSMTFLREYSLRKEETDFWFVEKKAELFGQFEKFSMIPANHLLYKNDEKYRGFFTLFSCDRKDEKKQKLFLRYVSNDGYNSVNILVSDKDSDECEDKIDARAVEFYEEITGIGWEDGGEDGPQGEQANFINQVHAINYKYIKNLALAVSDAISSNRGSKEKLIDAFKVHHPNIFVREGSAGKGDSEDKRQDDSDWDGIIVMLLIEASPTKVLEVLIRKVPQTFYDIAKNLCKRIDNPDMPIYGCSDDELDAQVQKLINSNLIDESGSFRRGMRRSEVGGKLFAKAAAMLLISSLTSIMEDESEEKLICLGNIFENVTLLKRIGSEGEPEIKEKKISTILGETFRHLLCFYKGVLAYGSVKARFDYESYDRCLPAKLIKKFQADLADEFMSAARAEAERLKEYDSSITQNTLFLIREFISLCKQCSSSADSSENLGRCLYVTLGKYEIMNVTDFEHRTSEFFGSIEGMTALTPKAVDHYTALAIGILKFLTSGAFDVQPAEGTIPLSAVYPFSATYSRGNENYDGYKTATFTLNIDIDFDETNDNKSDVNVLTEFSYTTGDVFYCLPNVLRSNKKWWIDPILVSFKEFNDIFAE